MTRVFLLRRGQGRCPCTLSPNRHNRAASDPKPRVSIRAISSQFVQQFVDGNAVWRQFGGAADSVLDVPSHRNELQLYLEEIFPGQVSPGSEDWDFAWIIML